MQKENLEIEEKPIPLIQFDPADNKFQISSEAESFLKSLDGPFGVITVAGLYRTGKSYLLNRIILDRQQGFGVGDTVNPCTKGLWVWNRPLLVTNEQGESQNLLVIDSEGFGALDEDTNHDTRIFVLSLLISSYFIYNTVGAIGEEELQTLAMIVNISKQLNVGQEDLKQFEFPQFLWVLRDFSLQLADQEGIEISSSQYLEKILEYQSGFNDVIEEKNRIRKVIKSVLCSRDCITMVRPILQEEQLQNLSSLDVSQLRPEFQQGVEQLRRKICNSLPKKFKNQTLDGDMYYDLLLFYVESVNNGKIPSLDNTWGYISNNQCLKAVQHIENSIISQLLTIELPISSQNFKDQVKLVKEQALEYFNSNCIGDYSEQHRQKMKKVLNKRISEFKQNNQYQLKERCQNYLFEEYQQIKQDVMSQRIQNLQEFKQRLREFIKEFYQNIPNHKKSQSQLQEFCLQAMQDTAEFFEQALIESNHHHLKQMQDKYQIIQNQYEEKVNTIQQQNSQFQQKTNQLQQQMSVLQSKNQQLQDYIDSSRDQYDQNEQTMRKTIKELKLEMATKVDEATQQAWSYEEKMKNMQRIMYQNDAEKLQEKELLNQKVEFLKETIKDSQLKYQELQQQTGEQKKQFKEQKVALTDKYQQDILNLNQQIEELFEKNSQLEEFINCREVQIEALNHKIEQISQSKHAEFEDLKQEYEISKDLLKRKDDQNKQNLSKISQDYEERLHALHLKVEELQKKNRSSELLLTQNETKVNKENAVLIQKNEFLQQEVAQLKQQVEQERQRQTQMLAAIQLIENSDQKDAIESTIQMIRDQHSQDIIKAKQEFQQEIETLQQQVEDLNKCNEQQQLEHRLQVNDLQIQLHMIQQDNEKLQQSNECLNNQIKKHHDNANENAIQQALKQRIQQLESQLYEYSDKNSQNLQQLNQENEATLSQLKSFYEQEKLRLESRLTEDKKRFEERVNTVSEEYEQRMRQDQEQYEEELASIQEEIRDVEYRHQEEMANMKCQLALAEQKIQTLDQYLAESKQNHSNLKEKYASVSKILTNVIPISQYQIKSLDLFPLKDTNSTGIEQQICLIVQERDALLQNYEQIQSLQAEKDREIATLTYCKNQLENLCSTREQELEELREMHCNDKSSLIQQLEQTKQQKQDIADSFSKNKNEQGRDLALANQKIEFYEQKISQLEQLIQDNSRKQEELVKSLKHESAQEIQDAVFRANSDKIQLEQKIEIKKQQIKQIRQEFNNSIQQIEQEKVTKYEKENTRLMNKLEQKNQDVIEFQHQIKELQQASKDEKQIALQDKEKLNALITDMEHQLQQKEAYHERDKTLWDNKFKFLMQQRDQARQDLQETQKKFDLTLQRLQKRGHLEKDKIEITTSSLVQSIESRYSSQLRDVQDSLASQVSQLTAKNKALEAELKAIKDQYEFEKRGKIINSDYLQRRVNELQQAEQKYYDELEVLKQEKEQSILEITQSYNDEKEQIRGKLQELEQRTKESEQAKGGMVLKYEQEKAKWAMERNHLISQKNEALYMVERLEKRKEALLRENEKLKNEKRVRVIPKQENMNPTRSMVGPVNQSNISFEDIFNQKTFFSGTPTEFENSPKALRSNNITPMRAQSPIVRGTHWKFERRE